MLIRWGQVSKSDGEISWVIRSNRMGQYSKEKRSMEMPRVRREKCVGSIYHVIVRGNNREDIFRDYADRIAYLKRLKRYKEKFKMEVYAYCLMTNHVHLLIYDNGQDISQIMQGLNLSYAIYFNKKYDRVGHLFQGRFTSIMVKKDEYLLYVSKYIHLNPVKANIVKRASEYKWSSYKVYMTHYDKWEIVSTERIMKYFADDFIHARTLYSEFINESTRGEEEVAIALYPQIIPDKEYQERNVVAIERVFEVIEKRFNVHRLELMRRNNKTNGLERDICIYLMALNTKIPYKQLAELFWVQAAAISASIKRIVNLMIHNTVLSKDINEISMQIAK